MRIDLLNGLFSILVNLSVLKFGGGREIPLASFMTELPII